VCWRDQPCGATLALPAKMLSADVDATLADF
jgi:hypothetical protein